MGVCLKPSYVLYDALSDREGVITDLDSGTLLEVPVALSINLFIFVLTNKVVNISLALLETAKYPITFEKADLNPGKIISTAINPPKTKSHGINVINAAVCIFCVTLPPHLSMITLAFIPNCDKTINAKYMAKPYILNFV